MVAESVLARIADNPKLPTPPTLTLQILDQASRPTCTISEVRKIISHDPALCSKMLRLVNSTLFGLTHPVTSIDRALNLLGLNHVRALVLSLSLSSLRFRNATPERMKRYWKRSVTTAIVCRELAVLRKIPDADTEMVAGLLCDLGEMLLQETFPEQYEPVMNADPERLWKEQCALEVEAVGVDHAEVAAYCLGRWKLGEEMTGAIRWHHQPESAPPAAAARAQLLYFAGCIAQMQVVADGSALLAEIVSLARSQYGMTDGLLVSFLESLNPKISDFASLIEIDMGPCEAFSDLFAKATENLTKLAVEASLDNVRVQEEKSHLEQRLALVKESLHRTEEKLRQSQKMDAIGRLAGGVAHDFNNLLTIILGNCDLLLDRLGNENADAREFVEQIRQTGERAGELTRQLLTFSRKQRLAPEVVQLNSIVANMSRLLRRLIGDNIQLTTHLADDLDRVKIDPSQISQVIMNLVVNARDAMPTGRAVTIETFNLHLGEDDLAANMPNVRAGDHVVLAVRDNGCGMDEATLAQIFEPFFTTKDKGKGTGLGLATVHGIVSQSGGQITVSSVVGQGTVFHICLPAFTEEPTDVFAHNANESAQSAANASKTILIADDQAEIREMLRRSLEVSGYTVLSAEDGVEALQIETDHPETIDLLITDLCMPRMGGEELARQLLLRRGTIRVLFISGRVDHAPEIAAGQAFAFLEKPLSPQALTNMVRTVLSASATA